MTAEAVPADNPRPRFDINAEQVVLGAIMTSDREITPVEVILGKGDCFYLPRHAVIYQAVLALRDRQDPADAVTVAEYLLGTGQIAKVGGVSYLHDCVAKVPVTANATHFARIVAATSALRQLEQQANRIIEATRNTAYTDVDALLEQALGWIGDINASGTDRSDRLWSAAAQTTFDAIGDAADSDDDTTQGISTGLHDVDQVLEGLMPGNLTLVAARPRVGKSVLLLNVAQHAAMKLGKRVLVCSLEMSEFEVVTRMFSSATRVPLSNLRSPKKLLDVEWTKLARHLADTNDAPLHVDESPSASLAHIRATAKRIKDEYGALDLLVVDYLQLMPSSSPRSSRQEQVAEISRGLKLVGKYLGCAVMAACQLNRGPEQRADKKPQLADMRESGSLEQDADQVILLHREDADNPESPRAGECDVIIAKNRHGRQDTVTVAAQLHVSRFVSTALPA